MRPSRRITIMAGLLLITLLSTSVLLLRSVDRLRGSATLQEVLFVSSPKAVKRMSLGYDGLVADIYWTRAVQYFGGKHAAGASHYRLLAPLLEITTALDPHLIVAYQFGGNFLAPQPPNGAGMPKEAIALVQDGIRHNPEVWQLYYQLGFIYYMDMKDYEQAARAFQRGSELPNTHPFLRLMAAQMAAHAGDRQMARMLWTTTYETSREPSIRANAAAHLRALRVDDEVTALEALVARYREHTGALPKSFADLQEAGLLRGNPLDPLGKPYRLMADGSVEVRNPDDLPFITQGTPPGYVAPPPKFLPTD